MDLAMVASKLRTAYTLVQARISVAGPAVNAVASLRVSSGKRHAMFENIFGNNCIDTGRIVGLVYVVFTNLAGTLFIGTLKVLFGHQICMQI